MKAQTQSRKTAKLFHSPTLETVQMVEKVIKENSGEFRKTQLWERLPKKVMWSTFTTILDHLEEMNRIITSRGGVITYIWNPELARKILHRKSH